MPVIPVLAFDLDREVDRVSQDEARRLLKNGQAKWVPGRRMMRLTHPFAMPFDGGRTHISGGRRTSRGELMAALGCSQVYTRAEHVGEAVRPVTAFKHLDMVDYKVFHQATLGECL